jgi:hypothetical protein
MLAGENHSDTIKGGGGTDSLSGDNAPGNCCAPGSDERPDRNPSLDPGNDAIDGGTGDDYLFGRPGNDKLEGGPGVDVFYGDAGNDSILARDGAAEQIMCGSGTDTVTADRIDTKTACERKAGRCRVPRVRRKTLKAAKRAVRRSNCAVGRVKRTRSRKIKRGRVILQQPKAGTQGPAGTKVKLTVSRGSR